MFLRYQIMESPILQGGCVVADAIASGRWKNHKVNYFNFSSEVLNRTSSQTCGRWYLPTFLLRDGSLTLMYRTSFIVLIWFKSSLPTIVHPEAVGRRRYIFACHHDYVSPLILNICVEQATMPPGK